MPQIVPLKDLKNTSEISALCHRTEDPIFITKNGYGDMVIMSMETYERELAMTDVYAKLATAQRQIAAGELLDGEAVFAKLREKYGT